MRVIVVKKKKKKKIACKICNFVCFFLLVHVSLSIHPLHDVCKCAKYEYRANFFLFAICARTCTHAKMNERKNIRSFWSKNQRQKVISHVFKTVKMFWFVRLLLFASQQLPRHTRNCFVVVKSRVSLLSLKSEPNLKSLQWNKWK